MSQKRVGIIGSYVHVDSANMTTTDVTKITTKNLGNMMFRYAVSKDVGDFQRIDTKMDPALVRENVDVIVIPMANNITPFYDMGYMARFLEACNLPTLAIGLGAQAGLDSEKVNRLPEGSIRFLQVLSELSSAIGVRGEFTAEAIAEYGVHNTVVTGCPSNFINPNQYLGSHLESEKNRISEHEPTRVALYSQLGNKNFQEPNIVTERLLFDMAKDKGYYYLHNFPFELIDYSRGGDEVSLKWRKNCASYLAPNDAFDDFDGKFRQMSHAFLSVESWMEFSSTCVLSLGKRVHGCLNTIQAGRFGVLIIHDSRTRELAKTIGLPHISINSINENDDIMSILEKVKFSGSDYDAKRQKLYSEYKKLFDKIGVRHTNPLRLKSLENKKVMKPTAVAC